MLKTSIRKGIRQYQDFNACLYSQRKHIYALNAGFSIDDRWFLTGLKIVHNLGGQVAYHT